MRLLFKLTTRSRHARALETIKSIQENCTSSNYSILCSVDKDDPSAVILFQEAKGVLFACGESKNKIYAINRDMDIAPYFDILVNVSDDQVFIKKGFDEIIREQFEGYYKGFDYHEDNLDQFLHFPDQNQGANCCTMSIMGRDYYNRDNFIYDPRFESLWSDIVAQEMAQIRGCYKYVNERIFDHLHPSFGQCAYDEQYRKTEDFAVRQRDYNTYLECKKEYDPTNIYTIRSI